ncbi:hypothetical protein SKAU_G00421170 [Synaphobranchus kaupii]|uniref:Interferon alpha-inducible protein 27-like protein 2A n=1 Tax=Synaphobranchus kaupii TaxID=118154 RepID=A0A9Q1E6P5_SYNKA|nr:hypothetical protein SKAU_G00421170 [Synaphobranchus kaupii]
MAKIAAGAVLGAGTLLLGVPAALGALGFTAPGIAAGSVASGMMSSAAVANGGGVAAGSLVASLQSVGAVGLSGTAATVVSGIGAAVGGACRRHSIPLLLTRAQLKASLQWSSQASLPFEPLNLKTY